MLRRREELDALKKQGINPYPYEFNRTAFSKEIIETFVDGAPPRTVAVAGRIMSLRRMGKASFCHIQDSQGRIQIYLRKDDIGSIRFGVAPRENLVVGSDMVIAFDNQRFRLETQASLGLLNKDISKGSFTQKDYDDLAGKNNPDLSPSERADRERDADDIKRLAEFGEKFITINENLFPLNPVGVGLPGVAYEGTLTLN
ncbi:MAG: hypothetical protein HY708_07765, partial [Ignavibacteriae bacterium]|nr:hypothetical protein [Ignavibacteriota bacterium]